MWSVRRQSMYVYILKIICSTLSQIQTKFERVNKCKIKMSLYFWDWLCPVSTLRVSPKLPQLFNHPISPWKGDLDFDRKVLSGVASKKKEVKLSNVTNSLPSSLIALIIAMHLKRQRAHVEIALFWPHEEKQKSSCNLLNTYHIHSNFVPKQNIQFLEKERLQHNFLCTWIFMHDASLCGTHRWRTFLVVLYTSTSNHQTAGSATFWPSFRRSEFNDLFNPLFWRILRDVDASVYHLLQLYWGIFVYSMLGFWTPFRTSS